MRMTTNVQETLFDRVTQEFELTEIRRVYLATLAGSTMFFGVVLVLAFLAGKQPRASASMAYLLTAGHILLLLLRSPLRRWIRQRLGRTYTEPIESEETAYHWLRDTFVISTIGIDTWIAVCGSFILLLSMTFASGAPAPWLWINGISPIGFLIYHLIHLPSKPRLQAFIQKQTTTGE